MDTTGISALFQGLTTPHVADACVRTGAEVRCAPYDLRALCPSNWVVARVRPARHYGSVDIFLEALENASPGEVLVIDHGQGGTMVIGVPLGCVPATMAAFRAVSGSARSDRPK